MKPHKTYSLAIAFICFISGCRHIQKESIEHSDGKYNLHRYSAAEEPYLSMVRTVQLLNTLRIVGWNLAHVKSGKYSIFVEKNGKREFVHSSDLDWRSAQYLFFKFSTKGEKLEFFVLSNRGSSSIYVDSPYSTSGTLRKEPIPNESGEYCLFKDYSGDGKVILNLKVEE